MQIPSMSRRNLVFGVALLVLLLTVLHLQQTSVLVPNHIDGIDRIPDYESVETELTEQKETSSDDPEVAVQPPIVEELVKEDRTPTACDNVDFGWLASDRVYWDGWVSKAMFMRQDGNFTTKHVFISERDSVCVVVLLGPAPAKSAIRPEEHLAPADSIVMTAVGKSMKQIIELMQHEKQTNVYYASVTFPYEGTYYLDTRTEYRSYFWEEPVLHQYRPNRFTSQNKLVVRSRSNAPKPTLPPCDFSNPAHNHGGWMKKTEYQRIFPLDFFGMFGVSQEDHAENNRLYVPGECRPQYVSIGQASECLKHKVVHVWADGNVRRNLKAFSSGNRWCNDVESPCVCNDDDEDPEGVLYPWATDASVPLIINETWGADTSIYFNQVGSINLENYKQVISERAQDISKADIVILGFGNEDIRNRDVSPTQFANTFLDLVSYLRTSVYPTQTMIIRTPQPFCCGTIYSTSWNAGRSAAFTQAVVDGVMKLNQGDRKVLLWDVHQLGLPDHMCVLSGTAYTKRNVVNIENQLLWNLICGAVF